MQWFITDKGDPDALALVDGVSINGEPHYSRQTPGARMFTRNGQNIVLITPDARAVWVSFRPTPGKAKRPDGLDCWECALFRNEGPVLSSTLIVEAELATAAVWGAAPKDGFITFVKPSAIRSTNPGYCYKMAGWKVVGAARDGKPMLRAPVRTEQVSIFTWNFKPGRGGKLRREVEALGEMW